MKVSIAVITYNSASTVIDTLDSIVKQDYGSENIELIISDDASTDDTVEVIEGWIESHKRDFYKILFIKNPTNLGVSGNINTAWKKASCKWVKSIAGDDLLDKKCIELNVEYVKRHSDCKILFSKIQSFGRSNDVTPTQYNIRFFKKDSKQQYNWLRGFSFNIAPSSFINIDVLKQVGYADERYRMIEDLPLWLKITKAGHTLHFLDAITVYYRVDESITMSQERYINVGFTKDLISVYQDSRGSFLKHPFTEWLMLERILQYKLMLLASRISENKPGTTTRLSFQAMRLLRPAHALRKVSTIITQIIK